MTLPIWGFPCYTVVARVSATDHEAVLGPASATSLTRTHPVNFGPRYPASGILGVDVSRSSLNNTLGGA